MPPPLRMETNLSTRDARGRLLQEGDEILLVSGTPIYFRIARITPVVDPKSPPNLLRVDLVAQASWIAERGKTNPEFARVQTLAEAGPMNIKQTEEPPPVSDGPAEGSQR